MTQATDTAPRIAVVIPCYNDGQTLPETVESVRMQEPCELTVVNDGSTDGRTLEVLEELGTQGVRVVHQENTGLSAARMGGVAATGARYVYPLDADDKLEPGALTRLADALDADPDSAVAWGDIRMFGDVNAVWRMERDLDPWRITYMNAMPYASLVRRDVLLEVGGWQLRGGYEDWDLWMSLAERGLRGAYVPGVVLHYRIHGERMWKEASARHEEIYANLRRRHPALWRERRQNWRRSTARLRFRLFFPLIAGLPLVSDLNKRRLYAIVGHPVNLTRAGLRKLPLRR